MAERPFVEHVFSVVLQRFKAGDTECLIRVRLRNGEYVAVAHQSWPSGAPTPRQLELMEAKLCDEFQTLVLGTCGVQGVLLREK